jgi:hypothetical protein
MSFVVALDARYRLFSPARGCGAVAGTLSLSQPDEDLDASRQPPCNARPAGQTGPGSGGALSVASRSLVHSLPADAGALRAALCRAVESGQAQPRSSPKAGVRHEAPYDQVG